MPPQPEVTIVTGGSSGIGRAVADEFLRQGHVVVIADLQPSVSPTDAEYVACDVRDEASIASAVAHAAELGPVSTLVNSAGVTGKTPIQQMQLDAWQRILDINLTGTMLAIKHAVPLMTARGRGSIVNIASLAAASTMSRYNTAYAASKGAVVSLTKALVYELSDQGVRINAIAPGLTSTPILDAHDEEWRASRTATVPLGRFCSPDEIAGTAWFLASDQASYITGQVITIDGGVTAVHYSSKGA